MWVSGYSCNLYPTLLVFRERPPPPPILIMEGNKILHVKEGERARKEGERGERECDKKSKMGRVREG